MDIPKLPEAEFVIMRVVWRCGGEVTSAQIMEALSHEAHDKKDWAVATVLNFLARLVRRGFLTVRRSGKINAYTAIVDESAYLESESRSFLRRLHGNSIKSFVASLYSGNAISQADLDELRHFIEGGGVQ